MEDPMTDIEGDTCWSIVYQIRDILWAGTGDKAGTYDPDKEWTPDTLEAIARELRAAGLAPISAGERYE